MDFIARLLLCVAAAIAYGTASAQPYPSKPVRMIVGFPAGGPADLFGRALAQAMGANLGQQVVVENKSGVGGVLGMDAVAKAAPDGYMLGLNATSMRANGIESSQGALRRELRSAPLTLTRKRSSRINFSSERKAG